LSADGKECRRSVGMFLPRVLQLLYLNKFKNIKTKEKYIFKVKINNRKNAIW